MHQPMLVAGVFALGVFLCLAAAPPATEPADAVHFRRVSITDPKMQNAEACTLLIPADWKTDGGIVWDLRQTFFPAALDLRVTSPDANQQVSIYPPQRFYWFNNAMGQRLVPQGSRYLGSLVEPPVNDIKTGLLHVVWPATHPDIQGAKPVDFKELPDFAKAYATQLQQSPVVQYTVKAGYIRMEYPDAKTGANTQEDVFGVLVLVQYKQLQSTGWAMDRIGSFKSPAGQLDANEKKMEVVTSSVRLNPQWFAGMLQVQQTLAKIAKNASDGALERANIQFHAQQQISDEQMKAWQHNQDVTDQCNDAFDRTIRGVQLYQGSDGSKVELPMDYSHAWTNGNGDYIMSNDALYNPNATRQGTWQQMQAAQH